jgi:hypothetical protein
MKSANNTYTGKDGMEKTGVEVVLEELVMLDSPHKAGQATSGKA